MLALKVVERRHELLHPCGERRLRVLHPCGDVVEPFIHVEVEVGDVLVDGVAVVIKLSVGVGELFDRAKVSDLSMRS
jgi:hypothetical protein